MHTSSKPAISNNFIEIKQMDCHIPSCLLHFCLHCRNYSEMKSWKETWLLVVVLSLVLQQTYSLQKFLGCTVSGSTKHSEILHIKTLKHFLYIAVVNESFGKVY